MITGIKNPIDIIEDRIKEIELDYAGIEVMNNPDLFKMMQKEVKFLESLKMELEKAGSMEKDVPQEDKEEQEME